MWKGWIRLIDMNLFERNKNSVHEILIHNPLWTKLKVNMDKLDKWEILNWLENEKIHCIVEPMTSDIIYIWFVNISDAVAFKLRWF